MSTPVPGQRGAMRAAKQPDQATQAGHVLLVDPDGATAADDARALWSRKCRLVRVFYKVTSGPPWAGRRQTGFRFVDRLADDAERARQRRRLLTAHAIAEAVGIPRRRLRSGIPGADQIADVVGLYFRPSAGPAMAVRRRIARDVVASSDPAHRAALMSLYLRLRHLIDEATGARPKVVKCAACSALKLSDEPCPVCRDHDRGQMPERGGPECRDHFSAETNACRLPLLADISRPPGDAG